MKYKELKELQSEYDHLKRVIYQWEHIDRRFLCVGQKHQSHNDNGCRGCGCRSIREYDPEMELVPSKFMTAASIDSIMKTLLAPMKARFAEIERTFRNFGVEL